MPTLFRTVGRWDEFLNETFGARMAAKRKRGAGWEYAVKRKGVLPKPITLTFHDEAEGDAYVAHLEKLLAAGIVPDEFKQRTNAIITIGHAITQYIDAVHITDDDVGLLGQLDEQIGKRPLDRVTYDWAETWVSELQAAGGAPSTIRKKVGALARCLDWVVRRADTMLAMNPLRILPKRYATTASGRRDVERDRRLLDGEEKKIAAILNREKPEGRERALTLPHADSMKLLFLLALETAMRMREIYTLTADQVNLEQRTIFFGQDQKRQQATSAAQLRGSGRPERSPCRCWKADRREVVRVLGWTHYCARIRREFEQHHLACANHEAGERGGDVVAVVDVERLRTECEDQDEGAGKEGEFSHGINLYCPNCSS